MKQSKLICFKHLSNHATTRVVVTGKTGIMALVFFGLLVPCGAQSADAPAAESRPSAAKTPAYASVTRVPDNALETRPNVLILPSDPLGVDEERLLQSGGTIGVVPTESHRLPEGYIIAGQTGKIISEDKWYIAHLDEVADLPKAPPLRILPNRQLSLIEAILAQAPASPTFMITGRVTEFQGVNYLLLDNVVEQPRVLPQTSDNGPSRAEPSPTEPSPTQPVREPTPEEIINELMKKKPLRAVVFPENESSEATSNDQAQKQQPENQALSTDGATPEGPPWPENTMLINRCGRIIPGEAGYMLSFEDQGLNPKDVPIRLLPNRLLETAVTLSAGGSKGVVFIVSGEVTAHRGINYLLLRKVLVRRNSGNLH